MAPFLSDFYRRPILATRRRYLTILLKLLSSLNFHQEERDLLNEIRSMVACNFSKFGSTRLLAAAHNLYVAFEGKKSDVNTAFSRLATAWLEICAKSRVDSVTVPITVPGVMLSRRIRLPIGKYRIRGELLEMLLSHNSWGPLPERISNCVSLKGFSCVLLNERCDVTLASPAVKAITPLCDNESKHLCSKLEGGMRIIASVAPSFARRIRQDCWAIAPIAYERHDVHNSFSAPYLPGAIFLSPNSDELGLAEVLIHEHGHSELNELMFLDPIVHRSGESEDLCYSPWRDDARPLIGLVHALYVFSNVLVLFLRVREHEDFPAEWKVRADKKLNLTLRRLKLGLNQLPANPPSLFLKDLAANIRGLLASSSFVLTESKYSAQSILIEEHITRWRIRYPNLEIVGTVD